MTLPINIYADLAKQERLVGRGHDLSHWATYKYAHLKN